ncbi:MAG: C25 family cysteine peptidase [Candidatus Hatepunaea meridiana]|nr:C25 family cysteine peptidase [Candidatus Hatepunaea meridiana]
MNRLTLSLLLSLILTSYTTAYEGPTSSADPHAAIISSSDQAIRIGFELADLEVREVVKDDETFDAHILTGEGTTYDYGKPLLPAINRFVVVPPQSALELVIEADEPRCMPASNPPALCTNDNITGSIWGNLRENAVYPPVIAEMSEPTIIRGVRMVKITTYPIQYNPVTNEYLHRDHIRTEIQFSDGDPINPVEHPERRHRSQTFLKVIENMAINGDQVRRDQPPDVEPPYVGHYCVVTNSLCLQYIQPFIEWRRKSGYKVDIISLSGGSATNANGIKNAIQNLYDEYDENGIDPFEYLLLVGDRSAYSYSPPVGWQLAAPAGNSSWGGAPHADYELGLLEGNDIHPDVGIGRWWVGQPDKLQLAVGRTLNYEATPYMDDTDWFNAAGAFSQHWGNQANIAWHITIHTTVRWGKEVLEHLGYEDVRTYERYQHDQMGGEIGPVLTRWFNDGMSIMVGRGELYNWRNSFGGVNNRNVNPIFITFSGHGEWACEAMTRTGNGNNTIGPVNMTCGWGWSVIPTTNAMWLELVNAVLVKDIPMGWAYCSAITLFELYFPNVAAHRNTMLYPNIKTDNIHFGDPGILPWIGVPRVVEADFPETITDHTSTILVHVSEGENDTAVEGAQVTLYAPGDIPDADDNDYAEYDDISMLTTLSDEDGNARFVLEDDFILENGTTAYITVTGRDIKPYFGEIDIEDPDVAIEIAEYELIEVDGNDDDEVNPGETFRLEITAANVGGDETAEDVTAVVRTLSSWIEVENRDITFGDIEEGEEVEGDGEVNLIISPACPDGASRPITRPEILITFASDDIEWESAIVLTPEAPNYEVKEIVGNDILEVGARDFDVEIENIGSQNGPAVTAELFTIGMGASVVNSESSYPSIRTGRSSRLSGNDFIISGNRLSVPGYINEMMLIFTTEDGFNDTAYFEIQVREPMDNTPIGPDPYGYICFDDTDEGWDISPAYRWVEISPREDEFDFRGERIDFSGSSDFNIGESEVIDLGFTTNFYGYSYDCITVGTNGFIAPGDQGEITNFMNWPMDRAMGGGCGMIAPLWDNLRLSGNDAGIYYYYDEDQGRFIVEWYKLRHRTGGNTDLTFQVILYDSDVWRTVTGDQNVLFQYKSVSNVRGNQDHDSSPTPYENAFASVGISSPDGFGLSYSYKDEYPTGAAALANRRAILFTTSLVYKKGDLFGEVLDVATGDPIPDVTVYTEHGFIGTTDEDGQWIIEEALAEIHFDITASLFGYNDSTLTDMEVEEDGELEINFSLLHPEFTPSIRSIVHYLDPDQSWVYNFTVENTGNGIMTWELDRRLPLGADVEPWEHRLSYPVGQTINDSRIEGVVFFDGRFYISGSNQVGRENGPNMIYILNQEGEEIDRYEQPCDSSSRYGMRDLAYDGELLWGSGERNVYGFVPETGEVVDTIEGEYSSQQALAWDTDREILWTSGITSQEIIGFNNNGEEVADLPRNGLRIYGLAYWPEDPDDHPLYIFHSPGDGRSVIHKYNTVEEDTMFVRELQLEQGGTPNGAYATNQFDVYSWVFMNIANEGANDRIDIWQLEANRDWFRVSMDTDTGHVQAEHGTVEATWDKEFTLTLDTRDLPDSVEFEGYLIFRHNAGIGVDTINVILDVIGPEQPLPFRLLVPRNGSAIDANVDDTEMTFGWEPSVDYNHNDTLRYLAWFKSGDDSTMFNTENNVITLDIAEIADSLELSIEDDFIIDWWVKAISGEDTVACNDIFMFFFTPNATDEYGNIPVEFGLQSIYPSPFNSMTTVRFGIDRPASATLQIYDLRGREVTTLYNNHNSSVGYHNVVWDASSMPSGLYIVRLESEGRVQTKKIALVR